MAAKLSFQSNLEFTESYTPRTFVVNPLVHIRQKKIALEIATKFTAVNKPPAWFTLVRIGHFLLLTYGNECLTNLSIGQILDCFRKGIHSYTESTQSHRPEEAIADSYESGFNEQCFRV